MPNFLKGIKHLENTQIKPRKNVNKVKIWRKYSLFCQHLILSTKSQIISKSVNNSVITFYCTHSTVSTFATTFVPFGIHQLALTGPI